MSELTVAGIRALLEQSKRLGLVPVYRYATVTATTGTNAAILMAILDGDTQATRCFNLVGARSTDSRVFTVEVKPHGVYAIGCVDLDNGWIAVETRDFGSGWANTGGSNRSVAYRLRADGNVELSGHATQSGTVTAPNTIFTLPVGFRPTARNASVGFTISNQPAAATAPTVRGLQITTAGLVQVTNFAGTINPGPISLDGINFARTTV